MNKKNLAGALIATLSLPLMLATFSLPVANAANVSSSVDTVDNCKWVMANVPSAIAMSASANAKFNGDELTVSAAITSPTLGLSGTTSTVAANQTNTDCSFYNSVVNASVSALLSTTSFVAYFGDNADIAQNSEDPEMNFELGTGDGQTALEMSLDATLCNVGEITGWSGASVVFTADIGVTLYEFSSEKDTYLAEDGDVAPLCSPATTVELTIPDRTSVPEGAGQRYGWTGPTITFSSTPSS
jgi:hypothetical protein